MGRLQFIISLCLVVSTCTRASFAQYPSVTLPWGTWQANTFDSLSNSFIFQNIRFGQPPVGKLRFQKPLRPNPISNNRTQQDNTYGPSCHQVTVANSCAGPQPQGLQSEDCLFLDVYVPLSVWKKVQKGIANTPVVVWIYGGAFEFGAKSAYAPNSAFYNGSGLQTAAMINQDQFIFVAGNYRLGAFGWLAGNMMEKRGTPNAGLYDQRLLLEWVRDYIHLFGGDKNNVAAWGESAGAGSIMHHLIRGNGTTDPLFRKALVQSPAFQWNWDRSRGGVLDQVFNNFTSLSNCSFGNFDCLVTQDELTLKNANQLLYDNSQLYGMFPVGPSVDGQWIRSLPDVAYYNGNFWKNLTSLAISHVEEEASNFIPPDIGYDYGFEAFLGRMFPQPNLSELVSGIEEQYPSGWFESERTRAETIIGDSLFYCNTRTMFDAYSKIQNFSNIYMMNYEFFGLFGAAVHASDLLPTFYQKDFNMTEFLVAHQCKCSVKLTCSFEVSEFVSYMVPQAPIYQSYLADLAVWGNPNKHKKDVDWPTASSGGNEVENVLFVSADSFYVEKDDQTDWNTCEFWYNAQKLIHKLYNSGNSADSQVDTAHDIHAASEQILIQSEL